MVNDVVRNSEVGSRDGTSIAFTSLGSGPGIVVVPGTLRAGRHYAELAAALAADFTVHTVDRRGRGGSGPQRPGHGIAAETADLAAVLAHTGATTVFGHSYGGLVALETAFREPEARIERLALYEPAVSINGSIGSDWLPELDEAIAAGRIDHAVSTMLVGLDLIGGLRTLSIEERQQLVRLVLRGELLRDAEALLPTVHAETDVITSLDSSGDRYAAITTDTLLLSGQRGPAHLKKTAEVLAATMPNATIGTVERAGHNGPDIEAPREIAERLRAHLTP